MGASRRQETFAGRSACAQQLRAECRLLAGRPVPICIVGEPGTGKATLARQLLAERPGSTGRLALDARACALVDPGLLLTRVAEALSGGCAVTVLHVEWLPEPSRRQLAELGLAALRRGAVLVMTQRTPPGGAAHHALAPPIGAVELRVPPLREHVEDVQDLLAVFLARHDRRLSLAPEALAGLLRHDWPGNAGEVATLASELAARVRGSQASVHDVPARYRGTRRRLGRLEQVERAAIVAALREAGGNKSHAAELLGIGRATLYRKLVALDLAAPA